MIFYAIEALRDAGITAIVITLGDYDAERFFQLLGDGSELGVKLDYHYHGSPKGIAYAINMCRNRLEGEPFAVHLGDNIFCGGVKQVVDEFNGYKCDGAIVTKMFPDDKMKNYGVLCDDGDGMKAVEKPNNLDEYENVMGAILGFYIFNDRFFKFYEKISPSNRGEYEITDMINLLLDDLIGVQYEDDWFDCGQFEDLYQASTWRRNHTLT